MPFRRWGCKLSVFSVGSFLQSLTSQSVIKLTHFSIKSTKTLLGFICEHIQLSSSTKVAHKGSLQPPVQALKNCGSLHAAVLWTETCCACGGILVLALGVGSRDWQWGAAGVASVRRGQNCPVPDTAQQWGTPGSEKITPHSPKIPRTPCKHLYCHSWSFSLLMETERSQNVSRRETGLTLGNKSFKDL